MSLIERNTDINRGWTAVKSGSTIVASGALTMASGFFQVLRGAHTVFTTIVAEKIREGMVSLSGVSVSNHRRSQVYSHDWVICENPVPATPRFAPCLVPPRMVLEQGLSIEPDVDEIPIVSSRVEVEVEDRTAVDADDLLFDSRTSFCVARNRYED